VEPAASICSGSTLSDFKIWLKTFFIKLIVRDGSGEPEISHS